MRVNAVLNSIKENQLFKNVSWMLVAEGLARVSRLVTLFVLASHFTNTQYGAAMLALVCHELFRVFTRLGTGAKIIQCASQELPAMLRNAAALQWVVACVVTLAQVMLANFIADYYRNPDLAYLLVIMALSHLFYPLVAIRIFELQRRNDMRYYGIASGLCIAGENLLVALLVFLDMGITAVAYCKVAAAVIWVALFFKLPSNCTGLSMDWAVQKNLIGFASKTLVSELGRTLRFQMDSLFAARLLSPELFGLYSFAKSAALGIGQSLSFAYLAGLYPYLCKKFRVGEIREALQQAAIATGLIIVAFIAQAALAPYYIQWLFDDRWMDALTLASVLCLCAIPMLITDHACVKLRAFGETGTELKLVMAGNIILASVFALTSLNSPMELAFAFLSACGISTLLVLIFTKKEEHHVRELEPSPQN